MLNRRDFLKGIIASSLATTGCSINPSDNIEFSEMKIQIPKLPTEFKNYRIAFVSDIHHGPFLDPNDLNNLIRILKSKNFDILILGGDYMTVPETKSVFPVKNLDYKNYNIRTSPKKIFKELAALFSTIKPKDGVIAIYGNHERWVAPRECLEEFKNEGINFLVNSSYLLKRGNKILEIYGVDDFWTGIPRLNLKENSNCKILVSHNPDYISELIQQNKNIFNLTLGGHTHGGQICLPIIGGLHYNVKDQNFISGLTKVRDDSYVFTSRGIGVVKAPYRINCRPEVSILELV